MYYEKNVGYVGEYSPSIKMLLDNHTREKCCKNFVHSDLYVHNECEH